MINTEAIRVRSQSAPGTWRSDAFGKPVVSLGYGERFANWHVKTDLYLRRRKGELPKDETERLYEVTKRLDHELLGPAYQAHEDVRVLLAEVDKLRTQLAAADALIAAYDECVLARRQDIGPTNEAHKKATTTRLREAHDTYDAVKAKGGENGNVDR